jgi:hypothetical protein
VATSLETLAVQLARALEPLQYPATDQEAIERGLNLLGWAAPPGVDLRPLVGFNPAEMRSKLRVVLDSTEADQQTGPLMARRYAELLAAIQKLAQAINQTAENLQVALAGVPGYLEQTQIVNQLPRRVVDLLLASWVGMASPPAYELLRLLGLIRRQQFPPDAAKYQVAHTRTIVEYDRLHTLLSDPVKLLVQDYGWGTTAFDAGKLVERAAALVLALGFRARFRQLPEQVEERLLGTRVPDAATDPSPELAISLTRGLGPDAPDLGLAILRLRTSSSGASDGGLGVLFYLVGAAVQSFPLSGQLSLEIATDLDLAGGVLLELRPTGAVMKTGVAGDGAGIAGGGRVALALRYQDPEGRPIPVLSIAGGTRLEAEQVTVQGGAAPGPHGTVDPMIEVIISGGRLVVTLDDADGFLAHVLPRDGLQAAFELGIGWSRSKGLHLRGAAGLEAMLPTQLTIGPLSVPFIFLGLHAAEGKTHIAVTGTIGVQLGPVHAAVARVGLEGDVSFPARGGNLGPAQLTLGFKPPDGAGLTIDAPAVSGGGFLELDAAAGRYSGVFELTLLDVVSVKAIGIITTSLPDGRPGFALLLLITADGFTPVPLGLGFELTGVGGLLALNRTVDAEAVRGGLRDGVLDSILFVKDPVHNVTRLLPTLDRVFPSAPDRLLIGPLAEISWGSPPILHIRLALLLEVPQPIRAVLLAAASVTLPSQQDPVVELHIDAIGVLDLGRGELALDASLHHSRLLSFTLSGDLALRLSWGAAPTFLLSVGGFHPRFPAPAGLRPLNRVALSLTGSDNPRVRMEAYLALTSNSIQLGARVSVYAEAGGFGIDGGGAFDALVQWSPFHVDVAFQAWVRIFGPTGTLLAARVAVDVSGPSPWHVSGVVELQVLFVTVRVGVDLSVGDAASQRPIETADVAGLLWEQVSRTASWQATLPATVAPGVTLRPASLDADPAASPLVVHPLATLTLRQQVVPLATPIARVGARLPKDGTRSYHVDVAAPPGVRVGRVDELFAPAQFVEVAEDAKLLGPAFAPLPAGVSLRPEMARVAAQDGVAATDVTFETLEVTDLDQPPTVGIPAGAVAASALTGPHIGEASRRADGRVRAGWQVLAS